MEHIIFIKLPKWKAYLYDLQKRWQIYKRIATRKPVANFSLKPGDKLIIKKCLLRFGKGESLRKNRAFLYDDFVNLVEKNQSRVLPKEFRIAIRISNIKKLKLESLFMELSELRKFGKEVGISISDMKQMDEDDLIAAIIKNVDPKTKYSDEFVSWYDDLPEDIFDEDEDEKPKKKDKKKSKIVEKDEDEDEEDDETEFDPDEVLEAIEDADSIKELHSIVETYSDVFPEKLLKKKDVESLQETMKGIVEEIIENAEDKEEEKPKKKSSKIKDEKPKKKAKKTDDDDDDNEGETELSEKDIKKLVKKIEEADDLDDLKALVKKNDVFDEVSTRGGKLKVETLRKNMLAALGIEDEDDDDEDEKPKKKDKKEKKSKKKEVSLADELEEKSSIELKRMAKEMGIKIKPDMDKDDIIEKIVAASEEDEDDEKEVELNPSLVKEMVKNKDLEGLQEAAETLEIKLGSIEKRSCKRIGEKLIEALGEDSDSSKKKSKKKVEDDDDDEDEKPKKKEKKGKKTEKTPFMIIEEMVLEEENEKDIIKAVTEFFEEKGKDKKWIKERVKQLIEVVKVQHDLEEEDDD